MAEMDQNQQNDFMIEKIKRRPVNKKKLLKRTLLTAAMAVMFGLIACLTFLVLEPVFNNWLYPEEPPPAIVFPEDQEEMAPEDMLADNMPSEEVEEEPVRDNVILEDEQIQKILAEVVLDLDDYKQLYSALSDYVSELNRCMVKITGVTSDVDWLDNVQENRSNTQGIIFNDNGKELLILADYVPIKGAEKLTLSFYNGVQVQTQVKQYDANTNLAVLAVNLSDLSQEMIEDGISIASLGNSTLSSMVGMPVVALGSPMGVSDSIGYGMIASASGQVNLVDANYRLLVTDIYGSQNAGGFLFNMKNEVIGVITSGKNSSDIRNLVSAYGISELKKVITKLGGGDKFAYLGIKGVDVANAAHEESQVPYGAYVTEVVMDSPAMQAGIQQGDVIVGINGELVMKFSEYTNQLIQMSAGQSVEITVMRRVQNEYREMIFQVVLGEAG